MSTRRLVRGFISARTTVLLLVGFAALLLLSVALPQEPVLGERAFAALVEDRPVAGFFLVTLGLGRMATSPVFIAVLALFFLNLLAVLVARVGPTWRRIALRPRSEKGLQAWARLEEALGAPLPYDWSASHAARTLRGFGYQVRKPGESTLWGVKHRTAPLGFLLFHVSFLLLCGGGALVYYTRFVGSVILSEGQEFRGQYSKIVRQPPLGQPPELVFSLESADPRFERGEPVHLGAELLFTQAGAPRRRSARVNHPARWGTASLLVNQAGVAPVLWLQDAAGFTVDRIVVPARGRGGPPTEVVAADDRTRVYVQPLEEGVPFPDREDLQTTPVRLMVTQDSRVVFDAALRPGEAAALEGGRLVFEELRYWAGFTVVAERGGGWLIAGFAIGTVGLIWRLLWYRREIALTWDAERIHLVGRSEFFSGKFQEELRAIRSTLERGSMEA